MDEFGNFGRLAMLALLSLALPQRPFGLGRSLQQQQAHEVTSDDDPRWPTRLPCRCNNTGNAAWSARATGSMLNLSAAVTGVKSMQRWPELHSDQFWHLEVESTCSRGSSCTKVLPSNATGAQERYAINRTGWVPTLIQSRDRWFHQPLILPLECGDSRGEDSVVYRSFFHDLDGRPLPADSEAVVLEMGAVNGLEESNSRFFETCLDWRSVLVEPSTKNFEQIPRNRPNATSFHAAVCETARTVRLSLDVGTMPNIFGDPGGRGESVRCRPLAELLDEVRWAPSGSRRVDYFSLDVEGAESEVIRSMGTTTSFGVLTVEVSAGPRRVGIMRDLLARGFAYVGQISGRPSPSNYVISDVFYNRSHFVRFWPHSRAAEAPPTSPPPPPLFPNPAAAPKPPEDKFEKKRRLLQKSHDAGTIDRQTYLQLVRETFDAQVDL